MASQLPIIDTTAKLAQHFGDSSTVLSVQPLGHCGMHTFRVQAARSSRRMR